MVFKREEDAISYYAALNEEVGEGRKFSNRYFRSKGGKKVKDVTVDSAITNKTVSVDFY